MPKSLDVAKLTITHDPNRRIIHERSQTPDFLPPNPLLRLAQQVIDALMNGFHGWVGEGFSIDDLRALTGTIGAGLAALQNLTMRIATLEGQIRSVIEDFLTYVAGALDINKWGTWLQGTGGGLLSVSQNGYVGFIPVANTLDKLALAIHKTSSSTHQQYVSAVLSTPNNRGPFGAVEWPSLTRPARTRLVARADATNPLSNNVFAELSETEASIGFVVNGATTILKTVQHKMKNGSTYSLDATADRTFYLVENSRKVLEAVDTNAVSVISSACRSSGFGFVAPDSTSKPGFVGSFSTHVKGTAEDA